MNRISEVRDTANQKTLDVFNSGEPVLVAIGPAADIVPGYTKNLILTSGPAMAWADYEGGQRNAILGAIKYEGLAGNDQDAEKMIQSGEIRVEPCSKYGCVGSLAGVYSASMAVFAVKNAAYGNTAYCNFYEGKNPKRLNYGVYDETVKENLDYLNSVIAPVIDACIRQSEGIPLLGIMRRALHMGDELHSRNTAASLLFSQQLFQALIDLPGVPKEDIRDTVRLITEDNYFFLRLSMAAAKAIADAAHGIPGSSVVTAMAFNCKRFGIRVSGLGDGWFEGALPTVQAKLFDGHDESEIAWMGGESIIAETVGLGGFAQAAAFPLQMYQGGDPMKMIERNQDLYAITVGENKNFRIPVLSYRGTPTGIDVLKVVETGILPVMDIGIAGRDGGQIGAGIVTAHIECFEKAAEALRNLEIAN
ncbi:DUF1116 domain-containing protein [Castellaniella sp.]|uniref:DUF1116 domain-containing protein n=1 Tax=Castellaniella sp. TaxID=1955812 RepID=UPI003569C201